MLLDLVLGDAAPLRAAREAPVIIDLVPLPALWAARGIYPAPHGTELPERMRYLHPQAADSLTGFELEHPGMLWISDCYRSAEASREAWMAHRAGVQRPGWSAHNFGLALDLDIVRILNRSPDLHYADLLAIMARYGWYCHRRDEQRGAEDWHFNHLGSSADHCLLLAGRHPESWSRPVEERIQDLYGSQFLLSIVDCQAALARLGYDCGPADGIPGPRTRAAVERFRQDWSMVPGTHLDWRVQRLLAYLA